MSKDVVRFYVTYSEPSYAHRDETLVDRWRPLGQSRCVSFNDFDFAEQSLLWVVGNAWESGAVWTRLGLFAKEVYADDLRDRTHTAAHSGGVVFAADNFHYMRERVPRTPPPSCVCVAIAFYSAVNIFDAVGMRTSRRDIRLFVGNHGTPPDGPQFKDLPAQDDENLVAGSVLRLAALSALG